MGKYIPIQEVYTEEGEVDLSEVKRFKKKEKKPIKFKKENESGFDTDYYKD